MSNNSGVNKVAADAHGAVNRASNAASHAADEALRKAKPVLDRAAAAAHQAVDKAADVAQPTADWLSAKADAVRAAPEKLAGSGRELVNNHPLKAIGIAVVLGLLIGRLL